MIPLANLISSTTLPPFKFPDDAENARRAVRHGLAEWVRYIGEEVGPKPGEPTAVVYRAAMYSSNGAPVFIAHPDALAQIRQANAGWMIAS